MYSMTGYARLDIISDNIKLESEIFSVNNRYLDIECKMPYFLRCIEPEIKKLISEKISRGKILFTCNLHDDDLNTAIQLSTSAMKQYQAMVDRIKKDYELDLENDVNGLLKLNIISTASNFDTSKYTPIIINNIKQLLTDIIKYKIKEGRNLQKDILSSTRQIKTLTRDIKKISRTNQKTTQEKIIQKITDLLKEHKNEDRIITEAAIQASKIDINEELVRLDSHIQYLENLLKNDCRCGKKIDFIAQELNREANTIASKSIDDKVSQTACEIKNYIEKIREQSRNIE